VGLRNGTAYSLIAALPSVPQRKIYGYFLWLIIFLRGGNVNHYLRLRQHEIVCIVCVVGRKITPDFIFLLHLGSEFGILFLNDKKG